MNSIKKYIGTIEMAFKISYLCLAFATFNTFLYTSAFQPALVKITLAIGVVAVLLRICCYKSYQKMPGLLLLILFCASFAISIVANRNYEGAIDNVKWLVWMGLQFFLLYVSNTERCKEKSRKEFSVIAHIMIAYSAIASIVSLGHLVTNKGFMIQTAEGELVIGGFQWGRLWGVYTDPNYGAIFSLICVVLVLYMQKGSKRWMRIGYAITIILNLLYMIFSDSRTGQIAALCGGTFLIIGHFVRYNENKKKLKQLIKCATVILIFMLVSAGISVGSKEVYNQKLAPAFAKIFQEDKKVKTPIKRNVGRKKDLQSDVSNGRLAIWKSSIELWKTAPFVGTGYATVPAYGKAHVPDTYMVQAGYTSAHNTFFNILLYQGAVGTLIFAILMIKMGKIFWLNIRSVRGEDSRRIWYMLACIGIVIVAMCFLAEGIYTNSMGAFVLWSFTGYMVCEQVQQEKELQL